MAAFAPWPLVGELFGVNNETGIVTRTQKQHYGNCSWNLYTENFEILKTVCTAVLVYIAHMSHGGL